MFADFANDILTYLDAMIYDLASQSTGNKEFFIMSSTLKSLRALSDQTRLRIVALLEREELPVNELQEATHLGQSRISTHLGQLQDAGLVQSRREGKRTFYRVNQHADAIAREFIQLAIRGAKEKIGRASCRERVCLAV